MIFSWASGLAEKESALLGQACPSEQGGEQRENMPPREQSPTAVRRRERKKRKKKYARDFKQPFRGRRKGMSGLSKAAPGRGRKRTRLRLLKAPPKLTVPPGLGVGVLRQRIFFFFFFHPPWPKSKTENLGLCPKSSRGKANRHHWKRFDCSARCRTSRHWVEGTQATVPEVVLQLVYR